MLICYDMDTQYALKYSGKYPSVFFFFCFFFFVTLFSNWILLCCQVNHKTDTDWLVTGSCFIVLSSRSRQPQTDYARQILD